ncbi:MAG: hypothetical protein A2176_00825 [Spirochaetes bacterium RBG_13_51_14]|nr:MAG: hypothetical protein A2176_00825 [Spirochaetes bacterium RBG_13_51_14]
MKKPIVLAAVIMIAAVCCEVSCKRNQLNDLEYLDISTLSWLQATVKKKNGEAVLWFQVFDKDGDAATIDSYKTSADRLDEYPAKIFENKWIWMLVNDRIEIRLMADETAKDYQDTEKLKKFMHAFDIPEMEKITGPKLVGKDLMKFIPKLGNNK